MASNHKNIKNYAAETAKSTLDFGENRLKLVMCCIICAVVTVLAWLLSDVVVIAFGVFSLTVPFFVSSAVMTVILLFLAAPLYIGTFKMAVRMLDGENAEIVDIFEVFASRAEYVRALALSFLLFLRMLPLVVVIFAPMAVIDISESATQIINLLLAPAAVLALIFAAHSFGFVGFACIDEGLSVSQAAKMASKARKGNYKSVYALAFSTLLKLLLSLMTLGILTVIHTVPTALLTYGAMAQELKNKSEIKPERTDI